MAGSGERSTKWPEHRGRLRRAAAFAVAVSLCATLSAVNASASQDDSWSRDFSWGVASSGYQSEGSAPDSNWKRFVDRSAAPMLTLNHWVYPGWALDKLDFIGIDYYYGLSVDKFWDVKLQPEGIYYALRSYHNRFTRLPLHVVENGMATDNGKPRDAGHTRGDDVRDTVYWPQRAKADGMNLIGYHYWSLTDNYEWGSHRVRFGLYTVDVLTDPALIGAPRTPSPHTRTW